MILTGENRSSRRDTCLSDTVSTINPPLTGLGLNPGLHRDRSVIKHPTLAWPVPDNSGACGFIVNVFVMLLSSICFCPFW